VHWIDGDYYRIQQGNYGHLFAARFNGHRFSYLKGAITKCTEENKINAEQAKIFGHTFHRCVFCSLKLDTADSTEAGYGPVCAKNRGLPWGGTEAWSVVPV
jgi:NADH pyrophosphatase NudC (nudix superfamily)